FDRQAREPCRSVSFGTLLSSPVLSCLVPLRVDETRTSASRAQDVHDLSASHGADVRDQSPSYGAVSHRRGASARPGQDAQWPWTPGGTRPISRRDWRCRSLQRKIQLMNTRSTRTYPDISD